MNPKVIDMHCDTITCLKPEDSLLNFNGHISLEKMRDTNYMLQCFAMFIYLKAGDPYKKCNEFIDRFKLEMEKGKGLISQVYCYQDIVNNIKAGKLSALLTIEEGGTLEGKLENLDYFYQKGVRMLTLTWNFENEIGYPNNMSGGPDKWFIDTENGLKPFGIETVKKMNDLGMLIDVSHLNDAGIYDCLKYSSQPIIASHSDAREICFCPRNLSDDMIEKMADKGGVTGINFCADFIGGNKEENQIPVIVDHIKHIVNKGGIDFCALGSDFDGIGTPNGMSDCTKMQDLYEALKLNHFTEDDIEKIFYKNFLRVFKQVCK